MVFTDSMNSPVDLTVDPSNPDRLYVVFVNPPFLMTSSDAGQTLTPVANFPVNLVNPYQVQVSADGRSEPSERLAGWDRKERHFQNDGGA